jgi:hypothetical protein
MTTKQKKYVKDIKKQLGDNYQPTDDLLIDQLLHWLDVSSRAVDEIDNAETISGSWQVLTTSAMASKQIQQLYTKLGITPVERSKQRSGNVNDDVDLEAQLK